MARSYAQLLVSIWGDEDYRALTVTAQWAYQMLISQRDLNYCGVLPYRLRRWSKFTASLTADDIEEAIGELVTAGYVVVDHDTEELWVRSFMRHNKILEQTQLRGAARAAFEAIESADLRTLVYEATPEPLRAFLTDKSPGPKPGRQPSEQAPDQPSAEPCGEALGTGTTTDSLKEHLVPEPEPSSSNPEPDGERSDEASEPTAASEEEDWLDILTRWRVASLPRNYDMRDPAAWRNAQRQRFLAEHGADVAAWLADWPAMPAAEVAAKARPALEPSQERIARVIGRRKSA